MGDPDLEEEEHDSDVPSSRASQVSASVEEVEVDVGAEGGTRSARAPTYSRGGGKVGKRAWTESKICSNCDAMGFHRA